MGRKNYCSFFMTILMLDCLMIVSMVCCLSTIVSFHADDDFPRGFSKRLSPAGYALAWTLGLINLVVWAFTTQLVCFHIHLRR